MLLFYHILRLSSRNSLWIPGGEICPSKISDKGEREKISGSKRPTEILDSRRASFFDYRGVIFATLDEWMRHYCELFKATFCRFDSGIHALKMRTCFLSLTAIELSISTIYPKSHFCTKRYKRLDFQGFLAFLSRSHGRLIKKTVNSRLKNANLCLRFGWVHFILTNHICGECLFFVFSRSIFGFR